MSRMTAAGLPSRSTISGALRLVFIPSSDPFSMLMSSRWLLRTDGGNEIVYKLARREAARFARHPPRRPGLGLRVFASRLRAILADEDVGDLGAQDARVGMLARRQRFAHLGAGDHHRLLVRAGIYQVDADDAVIERRAANGASA